MLGLGTSTGGVWVYLLPALLEFGAPSVVHADHIRAVPHFVYDENNSQVPVLKLTDRVGEWELRIVGIPGNPMPGMDTELQVTIRDWQSEVFYRAPVRITVFRVSLLGEGQVVYGPQEVPPGDNGFRFNPTYPEEGNYEITLAFQDGNVVSTLTFPMSVGAPGSPWVVLSVFGGGLFCLLAAIRWIRLRRTGLAIGETVE